MNLTVNEVLLNAGVLAVSLLKKDTGSGIKEVDLYRVMPGNLLFILYLILSLQQECSSVELLCAECILLL